MNTENAHHIDIKTAISTIRDYNQTSEPFKALQLLIGIVHHWRSKGMIDEYETNYYLGIVYGFYYGRDFEQLEVIEDLYELD